MIEATDRDGIRILRLAHGRASALDVELVQALTDAIERAVADGASALVLTGTGSIFCAGVDLFRVVDGGAAYVHRYLPAFERLMFALFSAELPVVAAANGHAIAGGAVLLAGADYRIMSGGTFGYTELQVGVPLPPAALEIVRFAAPTGLHELIYVAQTYPAETAVTREWIDERVAFDLLLPRALEVAQRLAATPRAAFSASKRQLRAATLARMRESEAAFGSEVAAIWCAPATHEHVRAYLARAVRQR